MAGCSGVIRGRMANAAIQCNTWLQWRNYSMVVMDVSKGGKNVGDIKITNTKEAVLVKN